MTKFSNRIKNSSKNSSIILANDYNSKIPKLETKTIHNIKLLHEYICGLKINFHLLLKLGKKEIVKIELNIKMSRGALIGSNRQILGARPWWRVPITPISLYRRICYENL